MESIITNNTSVYEILAWKFGVSKECRKLAVKHHYNYNGDLGAKSFRVEKEMSI